MSHQRISLPPRAVVQVLFFVVLIPLLPLWISRDWDWWQGWAYAAIAILGFATSRVLVARSHPDLLAERARLTRHKDTEPWDRLLAPLVGLGGALVPLVAGLDRRLDSTYTFGFPAHILSLIAILAGYALGSYALVENRFFSGVVRIQTDRGHYLVSTGPYRWIRHPGYAGALLTYLASPVFLDAPWAFVPSVALTVALLIRTGLEDKTLQARLDGYRDYAQRVPYRILPWVW